MMTMYDFKIFAEEFAYAHREQIGGSLTVPEEIMFDAFFTACKKINPKFNEISWLNDFWWEVFQ